MFSLVKKVLTSITGRNNSEDEVLEDENEIINNIKSINLGETAETVKEELLGRKSEVILPIFKVTLTHKTGKVTFLSDEYGLIDKVIYFVPSQVVPEISVKQNDEVLYTAYQAKNNESERVFKIYALKKDTWENDTEPLEPDDKQKPHEILGITRCIPGRVTKRQNRDVYIECINTWCNLDHIKATFVPIEGDWVTVVADVAIDTKIENFVGDIIRIKCIKPLLRKSGFGRVTLWSVFNKKGAIENSIHFSALECENGYIPSLGDEVVYNAIESDQETFKWRALMVYPSEEKQLTMNQNKKTSKLSEASSAFLNRNGIRVDPSICAVEVELNNSKVIILTITNENTIPKVLKCIQLTIIQNRQVTLHRIPKKNYTILPNQSVKVVLKCQGSFLGLSGETCIFRFEDFIIARKIEINVLTTKEMDNLMTCKLDNIINVFKREIPMQKERQPDLRLHGSKLWQTPKFISSERYCRYVLPKKLQKIIEKNLRGNQKLKAVEEYAPYLKFDLNFTSYSRRFHTLLYLEEVELHMNFRKYNLHGVYLTRDDDLFFLEVPGLVERRPSVIIGDSIILTQPWSEGNNIEHIGYIHEILEKGVLIRFHGSFHDSYDESECNVKFIPNTFFFSRCHEAVTRADKVLGEKWLFPSAVNEKPPHIDFDVVESDTEKNEKPFVPEDDSSAIKKRKQIRWVNESLNDRQKLAVVNVLKGVGRPLPYIIFGPPGTGKTVTLVEIILQIYFMLPDSRILVTTPSNSAADLICFRLIDMIGISPGALIRLSAITRILEGGVPINLKPYTTFYRSSEFQSHRLKDNENVRLCSMNELTGKHRITVATCSNIGRLHFSGFATGHFTHILVDEAGQTIEPEVLISATFLNQETGQFLLVGDPEQLGPVVCSSISRHYGLGESLLQRFMRCFPYARDFKSFPDTSGFDPRFVTRLNVNYRSVPEILSLYSQMFYNSDLIPMLSQTEGEDAEIVKKFNFMGDGRDTPAAVIFHGIIGQNYQESDSPSWFNPHEIWQVVLYVKQLYSIGLTQADIGIVSPYTKQARKLATILSELNIAVPKIGTVEEHQGQESKVVIVTAVRSSLKFVGIDVAHHLGFIAGPKRLNVAISRARALLIIIGNPVLLSYDPYWVTVIKYCIKNKSYTGCNLKYFKHNLESELNDGEESSEEEKEEEEEEEEEGGED